MISGNMVGSYSQLGKTLMIVDEHGNEIPGVVVSQETIFTATDNDVREGFVYASDSGVSTGTKVIPSYNTTEGMKIIKAGSKFDIQLSEQDKYDYTQMQAIICLFNTTLSDSVAAEKVVIKNCVYNVQSTTQIVSVIKNDIEKKIDLGITNNTSNMYVLRYFTYKEIY